MAPNLRIFGLAFVLHLSGMGYYDVIAAEPHPSAPTSPAAGYNLGERLPFSSSEQEANGYREIDWEALIPPAWDPKQALAGLDLSKLNDNDPGANEALARLRNSWAAAPLAESMNNARIRIAGFVVPLEYVGDKVTEFLLVPYFGACIHLPPPPPNQIIHVFAKQPITRKQATRP